MNSIFAPITSFFTSLFNLLHDLITQMGIDGDSGLSYVLAITLLTVIIRACLLPFNIKSANSNRKMQEIQPEVAKLQEKYKNDPQKAQTELMKLYKEKDVSMTGGCLPTLLPLPILMALYYVFFNMTAIDGKSFLWLNDLGAPDPYFILPILSAITTYIPSALMSKATPQPAQGGMNMGAMNIGMSIFMGYMAMKFDSILVIYWILGGIIQLATTYFVNYKPAIKKKKLLELEESQNLAARAPKFVMPEYEESNKASKKKKKK